jgi:hypothetical protein
MVEPKFLKAIHLAMAFFVYLRVKRIYTKDILISEKIPF